MERVGVLINKLQEQLAQKASVHNMLVTVQLLQSELVQEASQANGASRPHVSVMVPHIVHVKKPLEAPVQDYKPVPKPEPEPIPQPGPGPEPELEPEPFPHPGPRPEPEPIPIPSFVEAKPWQDLIPKKNNGAWPADPVMEVPTLAHQDKLYYELNDTMSEKDGSLNDKLKEEKVEMASVLQETPIRDLKKAISINERHRFIHELFRGDETMYERSIKTINGFNIYPEAEYWIQRELKLKVGWDASLESVKLFDQLVKRRFS
jgi:hypothetical protein